MHQLFGVIGYVLQCLAFLSVVIYAPFARSWLRGLGVVFILTSVWGIYRIANIAVFREPTPPLGGFIFLPFVAVVDASILRLLKIIVFKIPVLRRWEDRLRIRIAKVLGRDS